MRGYQTDWGAIFQFRRYLRRQVSISCCSLMHRRKHPEMGPCLRRGLRGEKPISLPQTPLPRRAPERRGGQALSFRKIRQDLSGTQYPDRALAPLGPGYLLAQIPG